MMSSSVICASFLLLIAKAYSDTGVSQNPRVRLRQKLLSNYDRLAHPSGGTNETVFPPVTVSLGMVLRHVSLDEKRSVLIVDAILRMRWSDQNFVWRPQDYQGLDRMYFSVHDVWRPDVLLYNSADDWLEEPYDSKAPVVVFSNGTVNWSPNAKFMSFCTVNLELWPRDTQICTLKFGSWTSHGDQIGLALLDNNHQVEHTRDFTADNEWQVPTGKALLTELLYPCCTQAFPDVSFVINLERKSPAYEAIIVIPGTILLLMSVVVFWLPPWSGQRLYLNGFSFLGIVLYFMYFFSTLPFHSSNLPNIVSVFASALVSVAFSQVINCCLINSSRNRQRDSGPPRQLLAFFSGPLGMVLCLDTYHTKVSRVRRLPLAEDSAESNLVACEEWDLLYTGLSRMLGILYALNFATSFLPVLG